MMLLIGGGFLDAIREVLVNALAHRDWTRFVEIEVGIYGNRLEVIQSRYAAEFDVY